jgi:transcriptional regulator GlxA family with amidase domain
MPLLGTMTAQVLAPSANLRLLSGWLSSAMRQPDIDDPTRAVAGRMAIDLLRTALARATGGPGPSHEVLLLQVKESIDHNLTDPRLTLSSIARANAVSLRYLHLLFRETGESAAASVRRRRLDLAHDLLRAQGSSIAEIAGRSGFDSPSSFSRVYKTRFGIAPRDARREPSRA